MGPTHIKAYRQYADNPQTLKEEKLIFDGFNLTSNLRENVKSA